jgi:hypothetical protein
MPYAGRGPRGAVGYRTYNWDRCPPGTCKFGYLAGKIHDLICHVHEDEQTKPCERLLLSPTSPCKGCTDEWATAWVGYVPLRDQTGRPTCILIRDAVADVAGRIEPGARVMWGKDREDKAPVWMIEDTRGNGRPWEYWWPKSPAADDMVPWLCRFFSRPHLLDALYRYFSDNAVSHKQPQDSIPREELPKWVQGVQDAGAKTAGLTDFPALASRIASGDAKPSTNGKKNGKH